MGLLSDPLNKLGKDMKDETDKALAEQKAKTEEYIHKKKS